MNKVRRIWCLLLALVMLAGMLPSFAVPAQAASTDVAHRVTGQGDLTGKHGSIQGGSLKYLSDLFSGYAVTMRGNPTAHTYVKDEYVVNGSSARTYVADKNFFGTRVYVFTQANDGKRFKVQNSDDNDFMIDANGAANPNGGYRTLENGITYHISDIALGGAGTKYTKGLSFQPSTTSAKNPYIVFDVSSLDADYFYAVAGITGEGNNPKYTEASGTNATRTLSFKVEGSTAEEFSSDMTFVELGTVNDIWKYYVAEFRINIADYNFIRLTCDTTGASNGSAEAVWADACVYQLPRTDASVTVNWDDNNNAAEKRPASIEVELLKDDSATGTKLTLEENADSSKNWTGKVSNLYKYTDDSLTKEHAYTYTVPADTEDYFFSYSNGVITASYRYTSQAAAINWSDSNDQYKKRPDTVTVQLYSKVGDAEATPVADKALTLSSANNWSVNFTPLPRYDDSKNEIIYSVDIPSAVDYYDKSVSGSTITLTCNYDPSVITTNYTATVTWTGDEGHEDERNAVVQLYADDEKVEEKVATLNKDKTSHTFEGIKKYKDGTETEIVYSIQVEESKFYNFDVTGGEITATYIPMETVTIPVEIVFVDNDNALGLRPDEVKVKLWADDVAVEGSELTLNADNDWKAFWTKDKLTADRTQEITYTVTLAEAIPQYTAETDAYDPQTGKLTVKRSAKADIVASIAWDHGENTAQPAEVSVSLYANDVWQETQKLTAADLDAESGKWTYKWEGKPMWDDEADKAITYSLVVGDVTDYVATVDQVTGNINMTYTPASDALVTAPVRESGFSTQYTGIPSAATAGKTFFLSDLSNGYNNQVVPGTGTGYKFFENYDGKLSVWSGANTNDSSRSEESSTAIKLGYIGKEFKDGISGMANTANQDATYITYDLTGMNMNKFYALAGITGTGNNNNSGPNFTNGKPYVQLIFEVWGSTDGNTYEKLAVPAKGIRAYAVAEFDVNITGYNYLKLAVRNIGTTNEGAAFSWADACVYSTASDGGTVTPPSTPTPTPSTVSVPVAVAWVGDNGETTNRPEKIQVQLMKGSDSTGKTLDLTAANSWAGTFTDLEAGTYTVSVLTANTEHYKFSCVNNTVIAEYIAPSTPSDPTDPPTTDPTDPPVVTIPGKYTESTDGSYAGVTDAKQGSVKYLSQMEPTEYLNTSSATTKNYPYGGKTTDKITIGEKDTAFPYGLGVHPNSATKPGYTVYDLTGVDADRFYAAVGITNTNGKNGNSKGVQFKVYADYGDGSYKLLAESDKILKKDSGEFHVDIDGVKFLKLEISATGGSHSSCGSAWANACVYKYDANGSTVEPPTTDPSTPTDPSTTPSDPSTQPTEPPTTELPGKYTASTNGTYAGFQAEQDSVIYLSEKDATDSTKGKYITDYYNIHASNDTTKTKRYPALDGAFPTSGSAIKIGSGKTFTKGLGVLPSSAKEANKNFILLDISGISNVDRFYAVAGMTGTGKDNAGNNYAVVFEVYGSDKVVTNENDASFKKLAASTDIAKADSGEFDVDISGIKTLKLVTIPAADNNGGFNSGCQSVWANACVYKYNASGSATEPTEPPTTEPTEPELPGKFSASSGSYTGIKAKKDSVIYLSEADAADAAKGKYISLAYIVPGSGSDTPRYPTLDYPFSKKATDFIRLGANNAEFDRGLGVLPSSKGGVESFILVDLTRIKNVDRFYAAVGLTGTGSDNTSTNKYGAVFEVYGSDKAVTDAKDASFKKLAASTDLFKGESGEFDVDISGLKTLKLVTRVADGNNKGYNSGCQSAWANACVYKYDANGSNPLTVTTSLPGMYVPSSNGGYQWISHVKSGSLQYLSALTPTKAANGANDSPTTSNYPYGGKVGQRIIIGAKNTGFTYGLGVHPKSGTTSAYTIYDVSGLNADYFYAAVGITNDKGKAGNTEAEGVIFKVSADYTGNGKYKLLAESDTVAKKHSGEFLVNIAGAKSLKLEIFSANGENASCGSAWANACVFKYDANGITPNSYTVVGASNTTTTKKTTTKTSPTDNTGLEHIDGFIPSEDGEYTGIGKEYLRTLNWLSDLTFKEAFNTTNSANPDGQPTTLDHPYNALTEMIILGEADRAFFKGLGVHPKDPTKPVNDSIESWTTYDVSDLNVDRFYAAVGITNEKGKEGASKGVIFKVYGDYGDGEYKLLSHSGCLAGRESGEFDLNISGVKTLKLAIVSASTTHSSSASAWGNACVYNSANKYEGVGLPQILEPTAKPTEPAAEDVTAEATEPVEAPAEQTAPISTGVIIALAAMGLLILVLLIMVILKHKKLNKLAKF